MAIATLYPTAEAAAAALRAHGWAFREAPTLGDYWAKRGRPDPFYGTAERVYLAEIKPCHVAPEYGGGAFYQVRFL